MEKPSEEKKPNQPISSSEIRAEILRLCKENQKDGDPWSYFHVAFKQQVMERYNEWSNFEENTPEREIAHRRAIFVNLMDKSKELELMHVEGEDPKLRIAARDISYAADDIVESMVPLIYKYQEMIKRLDEKKP